MIVHVVEESRIFFSVARVTVCRSLILQFKTETKKKKKNNFNNSPSTKFFLIILGRVIESWECLWRSFAAYVSWILRWRILQVGRENVVNSCRDSRGIPSDLRPLLRNVSTHLYSYSCLKRLILIINQSSIPIRDVNCF